MLWRIGKCADLYIVINKKIIHWLYTINMNIAEWLTTRRDWLRWSCWNWLIRFTHHLANMTGPAELNHITFQLWPVKMSQAVQHDWEITHNFICDLNLISSWFLMIFYFKTNFKMLISSDFMVGQNQLDLTMGCTWQGKGSMAWLLPSLCIIYVGTIRRLTFFQHTGYNALLAWDDLSRPLGCLVTQYPGVCSKTIPLTSG